jgi:O-acetyl-ADP-ribose deacetylase (regulator of RNase III)
MVTIKKGDLLKAKETVIAHQVNCQGVAGGLAASIFRKWPYAESDYNQCVERIRKAAGNTKPLLGMAQFTGQQRDGHIICNLYGQYDAGADYNPKRLEQALTQLGNTARIMNWSVALPYKLSCGICGGDWDEVQQIIERTMDGVEYVIYQREGDV